jgi:hypothetical protein
LAIEAPAKIKHYRQKLDVNLPLSWHFSAGKTRGATVLSHRRPLLQPHQATIDPLRGEFFLHRVLPQPLIEQRAISLPRMR